MFVESTDHVAMGTMCPPQEVNCYTYIYQHHDTLTQSEHRPRRRRAYSSSDSGSDAPPSKPPRRSHTQRERRQYDEPEQYPPPRRQPDDRRRDREYGYASDNRHNRPRRDPYDDRDRRDRHRDDRDRDRGGSDRRDRGGSDRRDRHRDNRYDDMFRDSRRNDRDRRARHSDDEYGRDVGRRRERSVRRGEPEWQKQAVHLFKEYALPVIKAEGGKYLSKQAAGFMSKR
jgi:hypothetical protein